MKISYCVWNDDEQCYTEVDRSRLELALGAGDLSKTEDLLISTGAKWITLEGEFCDVRLVTVKEN
jgi:hypothetical protein